MYEALSLPRPELIAIANSVSIEKNIELEIVFNALEFAIERVAKNKYGYDYDIIAKIDRHNGRITILKRLLVTSNKIINDEGEEIEFNPNTMINLNDAIKRNETIKEGEYLYEELMPVDFGRSNFQVVKQIILQKIKSAEKEKEFLEFEDKALTIVNCTIKKVEYGSLYVDINGKAEGLIRRNETIPRENLHTGDRIRALILEVKRDNNGAQILLTRSHPLFLKKLFEAEIPEVYEGVIEVKSVARDPGSRAKVAVFTSDSSVDPVGACVGMRGTRIQNIVNELNGEKVDVIEWTDNIASLTIDALAPAKIAKVIIDEEAKKIDAIVEDDQLSLAIGRHGQNVRLASQLLGWGIDVMSEEQSSGKRQKEIKDRTEKFMTALDIDDVIAHLLVVEGFSRIEEIAFVDPAELLAIEGFDNNLVTELQNRAKTYLEKEKEKFNKASSSLEMDETLKTFEGLSDDMILVLGQNGIKTLDDLADLSTDELIEILGEDKIDKIAADKVIMSARQHWFK